MKIYAVCSHLNRPIEVILMSTLNTTLFIEDRKAIPKLSKFASCPGTMNDPQCLLSWHYEWSSVPPVLALWMIHSASCPGTMNDPQCLLSWHYEWSSVPPVLALWMILSASCPGTMNDPQCLLSWHYEWSSVPPVLALWMILSGSNYPYLEQIVMVKNVPATKVRHYYLVYKYQFQTYFLLRWGHFF